MLIDRRVLHRGDAGRPHGLERAVQLPSLDLEARRRRCVEHDVHGGISQRAGRVAGGIVLDAAAGRIRGGGADAGGRERRRVRPQRVAAGLVEREGPLGQHRVELVERERESGGIDLHDLKPGAAIAGTLSQARGDAGLDRCGRQQLIAEAAAAELQRAVGRMGVRVDDPRKDHTAAQIDDLTGRTKPLADGPVRADCDDRVAAERHGLREAAVPILGVDLAVKQHEFSRRLHGGTGGCAETGRKRQQDHGYFHDQASRLEVVSLAAPAAIGSAGACLRSRRAIHAGPRADCRSVFTGSGHRAGRYRRMRCQARLCQRHHSAVPSATT